MTGSRASRQLLSLPSVLSVRLPSWELRPETPGLSGEWNDSSLQGRAVRRPGHLCPGRAFLRALSPVRKIRTAERVDAWSLRETRVHTIRTTARAVRPKKALLEKPRQYVSIPADRPDSRSPAFHAISSQERKQVCGAYPRKMLGLRDIFAELDFF